ncbi:MAG: AraC family transcriptional regulator [Lachnospiraceae bacterium]|jgi:AraC-like DNA-binding protein/mannose-6-phosphate isomerase-like protein (cupin superfamily)
MQPIPRLVADRFVSSPDYGYASIITDPHQLCKVHCHSYYEMFLVAEGNGTHVVNLKHQPLARGDLYFVRPDDIHCYLNTSKEFKIINILIPSTVFDHLTDYLGETFREVLMSPELPPHAAITPQELKSITSQLEQLVLTKKILHQKSEAYFRITIFNLLTQHFMLMPQTESSNTPEWLRWLSLEMLKKENFSEGLPALYRLSGKSVEHLSRSCKKYLNKTPSEFVNAIRLEYAAGLIQQTDQKILEICEDAGFESLSHFYHLFKQRYSMPPNQFRKAFEESGSPSEEVSSQVNYAAISNALPFDLGLGDLP